MNPLSAGIHAEFSGWTWFDAAALVLLPAAWVPAAWISDAVPSRTTAPCVLLVADGRSPLCNIPHDGAWAAEPVPCETKNSRVAELFPASLAAVLVPDSYSISPKVVIGERAL